MESREHKLTKFPALMIMMMIMNDVKDYCHYQLSMSYSCHVFIIVIDYDDHDAILKSVRAYWCIHRSMFSPYLVNPSIRTHKYFRVINLEYINITFQYPKRIFFKITWDRKLINYGLKWWNYVRKIAVCASPSLFP